MVIATLKRALVVLAIVALGCAGILLYYHLEPTRTSTQNDKKLIFCNTLKAVIPPRYSISEECSGTDKVFRLRDATGTIGITLSTTGQLSEINSVVAKHTLLDNRVLFFDEPYIKIQVKQESAVRSEIVSADLLERKETYQVFQKNQGVYTTELLLGERRVYATLDLPFVASAALWGLEKNSFLQFLNSLED